MKTLAYIFLFVFNLHAINLVAQETKWVADKAHTKVKFSATHMAISEVDGKFTDYDVEVSADGKDFGGANVKVTIDAKSIDTDNSKRDEHLRSDDFLSVTEYPEITFTGELEETATKGEYNLEGVLTIRGVSKKEVLHVKHNGTVEAMGAVRAGFKITGTIDRFDYNVDWNKTFTSGLVVGKKIDIVCDIELNKAKE
ncbi:YceI family protein [Sunxiuqinia indica]|uniref:YceI family protein n=1 Tax=Sunxiuqinia indica TaxID=2692584 RepID=UPI001356BE30|nr:YceI family protein [Sunxiuqinia indica]